jgi:hypothetical protein
MHTGPAATLPCMSVSMYIVVEGDDPGYNIFVNGRMLARHEDAISQLATSLGVAALIEYFSADANAMASLVQEGHGNERLLTQLPPPQWFDAADGLRTVNALVAALEEDSTRAGAEGALVLAELREFETVLEKTERRGLRWHLAVSLR